MDPGPDRTPTVRRVLEAAARVAADPTDDALADLIRSVYDLPVAEMERAYLDHPWQPNFFASPPAVCGGDRAYVGGTCGYIVGGCDDPEGFADDRIGNLGDVTVGRFPAPADDAGNRTQPGLGHP